MTKTTTILLLLFSASIVCASEDDTNFNTRVMQSTFKIVGPSLGEPGTESFGTAFLVVRAITNEPTHRRKILITADHVLSGIKGESAVLFLRTQATNGSWTKIPMPLNIRSGSTNLWVKHPKADLAAMVAPIPDIMTKMYLGDEILLSSDQLKFFNIHPGDQVLCAGYPFGLECNEIGFPIVRPGTIASYPILPVDSNPTFMLAFEVFGGSSGGPVFFTYYGRTYNNIAHLDEQTIGIVGIVVQEVTVDAMTRTPLEQRISKIPLGLSRVIPSPLIKEVVALVPEPLK